MLKKELFIFGTRPEIIKFAPLIKKTKPILLFTGQHKELAKEAFDIFDIKPDISYDLMKHNQSMTYSISMCLKFLENEISRLNPDRIWVQGDTLSAYCGALVAHLNRIQLVHLEAGLRSHDIKNPFPEEGFRKNIDAISNILFAPTINDSKNLINERISGDVYTVGNTIVDALNIIKKDIPNTKPISEKYILFTMHRRENFAENIDKVFNVLKDIQKNTKIIFPAHPNPNVLKKIKEYKIKTIKPLNYFNFLTYLKHCEFVMTDSGGIQEEVASFDKPILILRNKTERQDILDTGLAFLTNFSEDDIKNKINKMYSFVGSKYIRNPFGDGETTERIIDILNLNE